MWKPRAAVAEEQGELRWCSMIAGTRDARLGRILKAVRVIADIEGAEELTVARLAEAIQYRGLDRGDQGWGLQGQGARESSNFSH